MRPHVFSDSTRTAVLKFLAIVPDAWNLSHVLDFSAVRCLKLYVKKQAESLLFTRFTESSLGVDSKLWELLRTHEYVVKFLPRSYATGSVSPGACIDPFICLRCFATNRETYSPVLWSNVFNCKTVISNGQLTYPFIGVLLLSTRAETCRVLSFSSRLTCRIVFWHTRVLRDNVRVARPPVTIELEIIKNKETSFRCREKTLSAETFSAEGKSVRDEDSRSKGLGLINS